MPQPPSGTVTFLFTDIEGSVRLWEERSDQMRELVIEHDKRCRAAIEGHDGYVVKTTGDGFHAAFARATDAVSAAGQLQQEMADLGGIRVRVGINTGEVQEREGDYFGPAVNRAARLMAAGHGGQVLLAGVTADLVPGLTLRNLGEHRLRDLATPTVVWQLGTEVFPPLRTLDAVPGNLPAQRTSFVGRVEEVRRVGALVHEQQLVTLTGPSGVGKSRLALQVAADIAPRFPDGAWFVSLAPLAEGALVARAILDAIDVRERHGEAPLDTLRSWASTHSALVVIDNCEHLLSDVADAVDRVLDASHSLRVIATSQEPLAIRGEHVVSVAPLSRSAGPSIESVELFVDRARMARSDFALTADNEAAVAEICEHLDHLPLAIELAAARMRGMSPADVARRLDQRLRLLTSSDRLAPARHRTLDAAMRWSYELLDEGQRAVFDRLSVFIGPFTLDAATAVIAGDGVQEWEVFDVLLTLVDKSLVLVTEGAGGTRYHQLETMRQLGRDNLAAAGQLELYRDRHGNYYSDYVLSRSEQLLGAGDQEALDDVEGELENVRVALRHAADNPDSARFERLYGSLYLLWIGRGRLSEGLTWARELLGRDVADAESRILALSLGANVANGCDLALGTQLAQEALTVAESTGVGSGFMAKGVLGLGAMMQSDIDRAIDLCDQVLTEVDGQAHAFLEAESLILASAILGVCGAFERIEAILPRLGDAVQRTGNAYQQAGYDNAMAPMVHLTNPENALDYLKHGYERTLSVGNFHALGTTSMFVALQELRLGNIRSAAEWARTSLGLVAQHSPTFVAQTIDATIAIVKRQSPREAAVLLGALRAHRDRRGQLGSPPENDAELRYESSLRRRLGDDFETAHAEGHAMNESTLIARAFADLDELVRASAED